MFNKITENVEIHQTLPDTPNMTTQELKKEWDKGCKIIKESINNLVEELNKTSITNEVLYENANGLTNGTATLSETISNYEKVKIVFGCIGVNERKIHEAEVLTSNHIHLQSELIDTASRLFIIRYADLTITGTNVAINYNSYVNINHNASPYVGNPETADNYIAVYKIIGYKN